MVFFLRGREAEAMLRIANLESKMRLNRSLLLAGLASALLYGGEAATAGGNWGTLPPAGGSTYPNTLPLTGNETIPADTNLPSGAQPQSEIITSAQLGAFGAAGSG